MYRAMVIIMADTVPDRQCKVSCKSSRGEGAGAAGADYVALVVFTHHAQVVHRVAHAAVRRGAERARRARPV